MARTVKCVKLGREAGPVDHLIHLAALYKAVYGNASSSTIRTWLINNSTASVISGNPSGTPNRLLNTGGL
mgnify:CR=1 FL=1